MHTRPRREDTAVGGGGVAATAAAIVFVVVIVQVPSRGAPPPHPSDVVTSQRAISSVPASAPAPEMTPSSVKVLPSPSPRKSVGWGSFPAWADPHTGSRPLQLISVPVRSAWSCAARASVSSAGRVLPCDAEVGHLSTENPARLVSTALCRTERAPADSVSHAPWFVAAGSMRPSCLSNVS